MNFIKRSNRGNFYFIFQPLGTKYDHNLQDESQSHCTNALKKQHLKNSLLEGVDFEIWNYIINSSQKKRALTFRVKG